MLMMIRVECNLKHFVNKKENVEKMGEKCSRYE